VSQISLFECKLPHQYDFNDFQFDYKGVPGQALLTEIRYFFQQRYKCNLRLHVAYRTKNWDTTNAKAGRLKTNQETVTINAFKYVFFGGDSW